MEHIAEHKSRQHDPADAVPAWLTIVQSQVESLKFGTVQITVQDSKVVQIERNEKTRLDRSQ